MTKILITGANGQLGSEIKELKEKFKSFEFIYSDVDTLDICKIEELEELFESESIEYIINCAAYTNVDKAEEDYDNAFKINVEAVKNLSRISEKYNCKVLHVSTDYVFDSSSQNIPLRETDKTFAESAYGSTKLRGELELQQIKDYMIVRTSWLYSSFGHNFVKTMLRLGKERDELNVIFDQIGTPTYAADLADALLKMVEYSEENKVFKSGIYHYSNEGVASWYDFATAIMKIGKVDCNVKPIETKDYPLPAKRPAFSVMNKGKIKEAFGIEIPYWTESLNKCIGLLQ